MEPDVACAHTATAVALQNDRTVKTDFANLIPHCPLFLECPHAANAVYGGRVTGMYHIESCRIRQLTSRPACYSKRTMRRLPIFLWFCFSLPAQQRLYTCMITSKDWVVGSNLPP